MDSGHPECESGQSALDDSDHECPLDRGPRNGHELGDEAVLCVGSERNVVEDAGQVRLAVQDEEEHGVQQDEQVEEFGIVVEGLVQDVIFDPDNKLLKTASVIHQIPFDKFYIFGPNPVTDELYIRFKNTSHIDEILITSMNGKEVLRHSDAENPVMMNLSTLADGPYLLVLYDADRTYMERIVKVSSN